jgi:hypothetical protein
VRSAWHQYTPIGFCADATLLDGTMKKSELLFPGETGSSLEATA